jgi:hypothetical protein
MIVFLDICESCEEKMIISQYESVPTKYNELWNVPYRPEGCWKCGTRCSWAKIEISDGLVYVTEEVELK